VQSPTIRSSASPHPPFNALLDARRSLEEAEGLRRARQFDRAQRILEKLLHKHPDYVGALHTIGLILADRGQYQRALPPLIQASMLNPNDWTTLTALGGVYLQLGAKEMAALTLERALALKPGDASILLSLAEVYREEREYELAADAFIRVREIDPSLYACDMGLGLVYIQLGLFAEAAAAFERLLSRAPASAESLYLLSQLPAAQSTLDPQALLKRLSAQPKDQAAASASLIAAATAAALDQMGQHPEAWESAMAANRYPAKQHREGCRREREEQAESLAHARSYHPKSLASNQDAPLSLFILGPSRSGKTTLEALSALFPDVKRGYENPILEMVTRRAFQSAGLLTTSRLSQLPPVLDSLCRGYYEEELRRRAGNARVFTNTTPALIHDALRIAAVLPNVRFVFIRRDLEDICLRIFLRQYTEGNHYAYDLTTIREHVTWYYEMADLVAAKLPDISMTIDYEQLVAAPQAVLGDLAAMLGLPAPEGALPQVGDDRGCAKPYREFMAATVPG